jgi:WD40 repeat protein
MQLKGHAAAIYAARFNSTGSQLASAGGDKLVFLWDIAGECKNSAVLTGHDGPVLGLAWQTGSGDQQLLSCSADKTTCLWDLQTGTRIKRMRAHGGVVNSVDVQRRGGVGGECLALTGSDDCTANVWDLRARRPVQTLQEKYQILSSVFSDDGMRVFTAGMSVTHAHAPPCVAKLCEPPRASIIFPCSTRASFFLRVSVCLQFQLHPVLRFAHGAFAVFADWPPRQRDRIALVA